MEKSYKNKAYVCDILISLQTNQEEKVKFNLHYCYDTMDSVAPLVLILRTRVKQIYSVTYHKFKTFLFFSIALP